MFLLDSNVFIQAHRLYYGIDFAPGFWTWLERSFTASCLASVEKIREELEQGDKEDALTKWVKTHKHMFLPVNSATQASFQLLSVWAMDPSLPYTPAARHKFMASGDYQLIAYAHANGHVVATHEQPAPDSKKSIKIPDACNALTVKCIDPFQIVRDSAARFVLE